MRKYSSKFTKYFILITLLLVGIGSANILSALAIDQNNENPIYTDKDYISLKIDKKNGKYTLDTESKLLGAVDWIGYVSKLDPKEFKSQRDFYYKTHNLRAFFENEGEQLGVVYAEARSFFRYIDIISAVIDYAIEKSYGYTVSDRVIIPSDNDVIYLVRSHSGAWGKNTDPQEREFIRTSVFEGERRDKQAIALNLVTINLDIIGIFLPLTDFSPFEINEITKEALHAASYSAAQPDIVSSAAEINDFLEISIDVLGSIFHKSVEIIKRQAYNNLFTFVSKNGKIVIQGVNVVQEVSKGGKVLDRAAQMAMRATPLETAYYIVGNPLVNLKGASPLEYDKRIAYAGNDNNIWLIDEKGENREQITTSGNSYFPIKSPDGSRIIFIKQRTQPDFFQKKEEVDIFIVDTDTKETKKIARGGILPIWFPDSKHIFYLDKMQDDPIAVEWAYPTGRLVVKNIETGEVYYPLDGVFSKLDAPGLLSDRSIVYLDNYVLMLVDANGKKEELLKGVFSFAVSPDESKVAIIYQDVEDRSDTYEAIKFGYLDLNDKDLQSGPTISSMFSLIPEDVCKETPHFGLTFPGLFWNTTNKVHIIMHTGVCKEFEGPGSGNLRFSLFLMDEDLKPAYGFDVTDIIRNLNFSPNGNKLVYDTNHSIVKEGSREIIQSAEIYIMDLQTKERRKITDGKYPSW